MAPGRPNWHSHGAPETKNEPMAPTEGPEHINQEECSGMRRNDLPWRTRKRGATVERWQRAANWQRRANARPNHNPLVAPTRQGCQARPCDETFLHQRMPLAPKRKRSNTSHD